MYYRTFMKFITTKTNKIYYVNKPKSITIFKYLPAQNKKFIKVQMSESHKCDHYIKDNYTSVSAMNTVIKINKHITEYLTSVKN